MTMEISGGRIEMLHEDNAGVQILDFLHLFACSMATTRS
jgi:hypothetical protein